MAEVLQYRFPVGDGAAASGLAGHALGNLLIAAMTAVEDGDFEDGIRLMNRILAVRGRVLPVSSTPRTLHARLADGSIVIAEEIATWLRARDYGPVAVFHRELDRA